MKAYFQYRRTNRLTRAVDPIQPIQDRPQTTTLAPHRGEGQGEGYPTPPRSPIAAHRSPSFICLYLGTLPVLFQGFGTTMGFKCVTEKEATVFYTEDEAIIAATSHGCQPVSIRPLSPIRPLSHIP